MSKKQKSYTADFKTNVVLELLAGDLTVSQIASKHSIIVKSLLNWKKVFLANGWCLAGSAASFADPAYQEFHSGIHIGTAMCEWYESKEQGVDDFLHGVSEWWKS